MSGQKDFILHATPNAQPRGSLTRFDAANYLGISVRALDSYCQRGDIPKVKLGRKTVIRVVDLDAFLARMMVASNSQAKELA